MTIRAFAILALFTAGAASAAHAQSEPDPKPLLAEWATANAQCRGGSGDKPETMAACARRDHYTNRLGRLGLCYGRKGQIAAEYDWHPCGADSFRIGR